VIYIFSSAYYDLFKQNVLNAVCYPDGHVMRLRYDAKYVEKAIRQKPASIKGKEAVLVFAEGSIANRDAAKEGGKARDYQFYPMRRCTVSTASAPADIFVLDVKLGSFVDYGDGTADRDQPWDEYIKALPSRPWPKNFRSDCADEGLYLFSADDLPLVGDRRELELAWRSVVERLNASELKECITYRLLGFYRRGLWRKEKLIKPDVNGADAVYRFRSAETVLLKLLFYGDANRKGDSKSLKLEFDSKAFTSASVSTILVNAHYNEERIMLPCARTTDPLITSLSLAQNNPKDGVWSPQPTFMVRVAPPTIYLLVVVAVFAASFLFGSLGKFSDLWKEIDWAAPGSIGDHLAKPAAGFLFLLASWLYLRKFPLK
jgi:hypothetical protein